MLDFLATFSYNKFMDAIRIGQKTELDFKVSSGDEIKLLCSIKEIHNDRVVLDFSRDIITFADYLQEGEEVNMKIFTPSGIKLSDVVILDSPTTGNFIVEFGDDYKEIQRRKHIRAKIQTKLIIRRPQKEPVVTKTIEISGGALRFLTDEPFKNREQVECFLYLPRQIHSIQANGVIVKAEHLAHNEQLLLFTRIQDFDVARINRKCNELNGNDTVDKLSKFSYNNY